MKLSFIIPVYNVEKWVGRCLDSCLSQNLPENDYEIIVVNDGTKDNSMAIVEEYSKSHSNIVVVNQQNQGLSVARNTGIAMASGDYLWFVDSDDFLESDKANSLLAIAIEKDLDVLAFELYITKEMSDGYSRDKYVIPSSISNEVVSGHDFVASVGMPPAAWCALFRRQFLLDNNLRYMPGILHEDQEFTPRAYCLANRISFADKIYAYNYMQREGSIMKSMDKMAKKSKDLLAVCDSLYDFTQTTVCKSHPAYSAMLGKVAFAFSQSLKNHVEGSPGLGEYRQKDYYPLFIPNNIGKKEAFKYKLINISLPLYLFLMRLK